MSTTMIKPAEVTRSWYVIDAADKPLGRVAAKAAHLLRGKHKPTYTPHVDGGDFVIIINADKAVLTGKKAVQKYHYHHTGWIGHLKQVRYDDLMAKNSDRAFKYAVNGMLPNNHMGRTQFKRLHVFKGAEHKHAAQKPVAVEV